MAAPTPTFLEFLDFIGVKPTPYQRAICRVAFDGGNVADDPLAQRAFGKVESIPAVCRDIFVAVCGARAGKSYIFTALPLLWKAVTVPLNTMAPGQQAAALLVAPSVRLARETYRYALGAVKANKYLASMLKSETADMFSLVRPDGVVTYECVPATSGGAALRGRSLVAAAMDECAFFRDESYSINDVHIFQAITPRILPGGILVVPSTPWAKMGLLFDLWKKNHGHPETCVVAHAPTKLLRPTMAELVERERKRDPDNAAREFDAEFMDQASGSFFDAQLLEDAIDKNLVLGKKPPTGAIVTVGADFAFTSDSSALVVAHQVGKRRIVADIHEMKPTKAAPLKPSQVVERFAAVAKDHRADAVVADGHYRESISELLSTYDIGFVSAPTGMQGKAKQYQYARTLFRERLVTLPDDARLLAQLKEVEYRATSGGATTVSSPRWRTGGHGDLASAMVLALYRFGGFEVMRDEPEKGTKEWYAKMESDMLEAHIARQKGKGEEDWWDYGGGDPAA